MTAWIQIAPIFELTSIARRRRSSDEPCPITTGTGSEADIQPALTPLWTVVDNRNVAPCSLLLLLHGRTRLLEMCSAVTRVMACS